MFLSNPVKIFRTVCVLSMIFSGCSLWRGNENSSARFVQETKSDYPFNTGEPEVFQTKIMIRSGGTERRMFLARDHDRRRIDYDIGTDDHRAVILREKQYLLSFKRKTYSEQPIAPNAGAIFDTPLSPMLNRRNYSQFEEIDREGAVIEFRARINESSTSEIAIFFDETIGLPVKQEFYSIVGDERTMQYLYELYEFSTSVDPAVFEVPSGFRRVSQR